MSPARRRAERAIAQETRLRESLEEQADQARKEHHPEATHYLELAIQAGQRIQRLRRQLPPLGPEEHADQLSLFAG